VVTAQRSRSPHVNLVVGCTNRKSWPIPSRLQLRQVTAVTTTRRVRDWTRRLDNESSVRVPAAELYAGEAWDVTRNLVDHATKDSLALWICSAGLGLIASDSAMPAYSATFEPSHPDGIPGGTTATADWWTALGTWDGLNPGPRTLRELALQNSSARLLVVLAPLYLRACRTDLMAAAAELDDDGQLSVISAGTKRDESLQRYLLPVDARLQAKVGGTMHSLNIRVARALLESGAETHTNMRDLLTRWLRSQPPLRRFDRHSVDDREVREFVRDRLDNGEGPSHSRLLREFRALGNACEQGRFARLFEQEKVAHGCHL
jgi:hypothetical protein